MVNIDKPSSRTRILFSAGCLTFQPPLRLPGAVSLTAFGGLTVSGS